MTFNWTELQVKLGEYPRFIVFDNNNFKLEDNKGLYGLGMASIVYHLLRYSNELQTTLWHSQIISTQSCNFLLKMIKAAFLDVLQIQQIIIS